MLVSTYPVNPIPPAYYESSWRHSPRNVTIRLPFSTVLPPGCMSNRAPWPHAPANSLAQNTSAYIQGPFRIEQMQPLCQSVPTFRDDMIVYTSTLTNIQSVQNWIVQTNANVAQKRSKVHHLTSSAPDIDRVIEETGKTPFTNIIAYARLRDVHLRAFRLPITWA